MGQSLKVLLPLLPCEIVLEMVCQAVAAGAHAKAAAAVVAVRIRDPEMGAAVNGKGRQGNPQTAGQTRCVMWWQPARE